MAQICGQCQNRRPPDRSAQDAMSAPGSSASMQAALNELRNKLEVDKRQEDLVYRSEGRGAAVLERRPLLHDWCSAQSKSREGLYFFCDWLKLDSCGLFAQAGDPHGLNARPASPAANGAATPVTAMTPEQTAPAPAASPAPVEWRLPLGSAYCLRAFARRAEDDALGLGSFQLDYREANLEERPAIAGAGLAQTYLVFGGPGAGKTYYFKYLLSSLLAHERRPGCLLLDPKGALTRWLAGELGKIGRSEDLFLITPGASAGAFNVLGHDLPPKELGRLLSEVVLAGAAGIDEGWAVLVGDLLEAAAVVIAADDRKQLTAERLLKDILYRAPFKHGDGRREMQYPIVYRALRVSIEKKDDLDARIACDRIAEYFSNALEPRQRRFVRQIIERTLAELILPEWRYLSGAADNETLYTDIIERGRVVSVAVGQSSPAFQRSMSTLIKALFQQAVLAHLSRRPEGAPTPFFILACDEYAQAITEGQTGLVSDSRFFSLSREAGCMSLMALQSVATGRSRFPADMHDRWEGILGNVTVKMFMRVNDVETAQMASDLAGTQHTFVQVLSQQQSAQGLSHTDSLAMVEHPRVPPWYLTNRMPQGHALVHGTLDGKAVPTSLFIRVPQKP